MKVLFRAALLLMALLFVLGIIKLLVVKLLFFALWIAAISFVVYVVYSIVKPAV
jgi:hypothetical protein